MTDRPLDALPEGTKLAGYIVGRVLGRGGFGITYFATDALHGDVKVAIKEFLPSGLATREAGAATVHPVSREHGDAYRRALDSFEREARNLVMLRHPNVVDAQRYIELNGTAYVVMKYEEGKSLSELLGKGKTLSEAEVLDILPPLLDGLEAVHAKKFIHRDLKPGNIYLRIADGSPVLLDFGAARQAIGDERKSSLSEIYTPGYAPLEQYDRHAEQGPYTDIYALGATLYRCLSGETPPESITRHNALRLGRPDPLVPLDAAAKQRVSEPLKAAVRRSLALDERERPQSVAELRGILGLAPEAGSHAATSHRTLAGVSPVSRPSSELSWPKRRRRAAGWAALAAVAVAAGAGAVATMSGGPKPGPDVQSTTAEDVAKRRADEEAKRIAAEQARRRAEEAEAKRKREAEEAKRRDEQDEARRRAEEAKRRADDEAKRKAEQEEVRRRADEDAKRKKEQEDAERNRQEAERDKRAQEARRADLSRHLAEAERFVGAEKFDEAEAALEAAARVDAAAPRVAELRRRVAALRDAARSATGTIKAIMSSHLHSTDPLLTLAQITRTHGYMIYDTLFAFDANQQIRPQMVESWQSSADKLTWTFALRDGLRWHDGANVTSDDVIASIERWAKRDVMGRALAAATKEWKKIDDRTFQLVLNEPFGPVLDALGKPSASPLFVMPRDVALAPAETRISDHAPDRWHIGSGPFRLVRAEYQPATKVVYQRNAAYVPRNEPPSGLAGGKIVKVARVEWISVADPPTALAALRAGEVELYEQPRFDFLKDASRHGLELKDYNKLGQSVWMRINWRHPPFDNQKVRQAVMAAVDQRRFLTAVTGNAEWVRPCQSFFPCGSQLESSNGAPSASVDAARRLLREGGYRGERIVILQPADFPALSALGHTAAETLRGIGMNVDLQVLDWASVVSRRAKKDPPSQGGWHIFSTYSHASDLLNPISHIGVNAGGDNAWFGWPKDDEIERLRAAFAREGDAAQRKQIADALTRRAFEIGLYVPLGQFQWPSLHGSRISSMPDAPVTVFWGVQKR